MVSTLPILLALAIGWIGAAEAAHGTGLPETAHRRGPLSLYARSSPGRGAAELGGEDLDGARRWPRIRPWPDLKHAVTTFAKDGWFVYTAPARLNWNSALWLAGLTAVGGVLYAYDEEIHEELKRIEFRDGYRWFREIGETAEPVGHMGNMNRYYFGALAVGYLLSIDPITLVSGQILEAHFISGGLKNLGGAAVGRFRPEAHRGPRHFADGTSFPSGHTINIYELAAIFAHHLPFLPLQITLYGVATAVAFQRVTSDAHWPSDVYVAGVLGFVTARAILRQHESRRVVVTPTIREGGSVGLTLTLRF